MDLVGALSTNGAKAYFEIFREVEAIVQGVIGYIMFVSHDNAGNIFPDLVTLTE